MWTEKIARHTFNDYHNTRYTRIRVTSLNFLSPPLQFQLRSSWLPIIPKCMKARSPACAQFFPLSLQLLRKNLSTRHLTSRHGSEKSKVAAFLKVNCHNQPLCRRRRLVAIQPSLSMRRSCARAMVKLNLLQSTRLALMHTNEWFVCCSLVSYYLTWLWASFVYFEAMFETGL